jgi:tetratricopeptide (TPR) repeat protein
MIGISARRLILVAAALVAAASASLSAQRLGPASKRPRLQADADTNDARAYFALGMQQFERDPQESAAAFYWAARINPSWADALYARRAALLMTDRRKLRLVMEGNARALEASDMRQLDSLQFRALMLNPFFFRKLDRPLFMSYVRNAVTGGNRRDQTPDLNFAINTYLQQASDEVRGWLAYSDANFPAALTHYQHALESAKGNETSVRLDIARIHALQGKADEAIAAFGIALDEMRSKDQKDLVVFYNSKAIVEYSIAVLLEGSQSVAKAREAYGRALQEDIAYYPAHMRLGLVALGGEDTTTAMSELALASQLAPDEPQIRYVHGYVLAACGHFAQAIVELHKAIELEPFYALPHLRLGQVYEQVGKSQEALDAYEQFLARSQAVDPQRGVATEHIAELKKMIAAQSTAKP